jgi:hypothetical protein
VAANETTDYLLVDSSTGDSHAPTVTSLQREKKKHQDSKTV